MAEIQELIQKWGTMGAYTERKKLQEKLDKKIENGLTKTQAVKSLKALNKAGDQEAAHIYADKILCAMVDDEISDAFEEIGKWYA